MDTPAPHGSAAPEVCGRLRSIAERTPPLPDRPNGAYHSVKLDTEDWTAVIDRFRLANGAWWNLLLDRWTLHVKHYLPGDKQAVHEDLHPAAARRKFAGTIQLSDPDEYEGGDLVIYATDAATCMPRAGGSLSAWPGWTSHEVEKVTAGERWCLIVNGFGPPLR